MAAAFYEFYRWFQCEQVALSKNLCQTKTQHRSKSCALPSLRDWKNELVALRAHSSCERGIFAYTAPRDAHHASRASQAVSTAPRERVKTDGHLSKYWRGDEADKPESKQLQQPLVSPSGGRRGQGLCRPTEAGGEAELSDLRGGRASLSQAQRGKGEACSVRPEAKRPWPTCAPAPAAAPAKKK